MDAIGGLASALVVAPLHVGLAEECKRNWGVGGAFIGEIFAKVRFSSEVEFEFELRDSISRVIGRSRSPRVVCGLRSPPRELMSVIIFSLLPCFNLNMSPAVEAHSTTNFVRIPNHAQGVNGKLNGRSIYNSTGNGQGRKSQHSRLPSSTVVRTSKRA